MKSGLTRADGVFRIPRKKVGRGVRPVRPLSIHRNRGRGRISCRGVEAAIRWGWATKQDITSGYQPHGQADPGGPKGRLWLELTMEGITAHASKSPGGRGRHAGHGRGRKPDPRRGIKDCQPTMI